MTLSEVFKTCIATHSQMIGVDGSSISTKKQAEKFLQCKSLHEWKKCELQSKSKEELVQLCRQIVQGFKETMTKKPKSYLIELVMDSNISTTTVLGQEQVQVAPVANHSLSKYTKAHLLEHCKTHPRFQKSLGRQKKEVIIEFMTLHQITVSPPPTQDDKTKMSKDQLLALCNTNAQFDKKVHGKTKKSMLLFLDSIASNPPSEKKKTPEGGTCSPIHVNELLESPDDMDVLKDAILRCLMSTVPFQKDPNLEKKIAKII